KAQDELDSVGNTSRPDFADKDSLPYVNAITEELLRWHNVLPLGRLINPLLDSSNE
ncbi:hypothetical protein BD779DRAFT_1450496, partial [Infundibulicybe gibba]